MAAEKRWVVLAAPPQTFFDEFPELPATAARLLYHRGLTTQEEIDEFLDPEWNRHVHDPFLFKDMKRAVKRLEQAIKQEEQITIHGDYDADGVSASVILYTTLQILGAKVNVFLPHRETDGYGVNKNTISLLASEGTKLIITCDCGIASVEEIMEGNKLGIDTIITDHHMMKETLPPAYAILHPKVANETYPFKDLAGGGVAYKLAQASLRTLGKNTPRINDVETFEKWLLDMVTTSTIGDMVPLRGENHTLVRYGLMVLNKTKRLGLQKLIEVAGLTSGQIGTGQVSFQIVPRINAAGRMNHANVAFKLLVEQDEKRAIELARELNGNNQDRQKMTEFIMRELAPQVQAQKDKKVLVVAGRDWPLGLVGLLAGKIMEAEQKPCIILTMNKGDLAGSGRSLGGISLLDIFAAAGETVKQSGGHHQAAGLRLASPETLPEFQKRAWEFVASERVDNPYTPELEIDAEVALEDVHWELYDVLERFQPFGMENREPKYLARNLTVAGLQPVGNDGKHLRLMVKHNNEVVRKCIGFSFGEWCERLQTGDKIDMVFEVGVNEWNGNRELQLKIIDIRLSS